MPSLKGRARRHATTTSITWNYEIDEGFTYALTVLATNRDTAAAPDVADCSSGDAADSPSEVRTDDFEVSHRVRSPDPYRDYRLCARAENDYGASEWTFIGESVPTLPAAPSVPSYEPDESEIETEIYGGQKVTRLVWSVAGSDGTPQDRELYAVTVFRSNERSIPRGQTQNACETPTDTDFGGTVIGGTPTKANTNDGIEIEVAAANLVSSALTPDEYYVYACVRADPTETTGDEGGWSVSRPQMFVAGQTGLGKPDSPVTDITTAGQVKWTWSRANDADGYQVQYAVDRDVVRNHDPTADVSQVASGATPEYIVKKPAGTTVALRVRYHQTVGGTRLYSPWSDDVNASVPAS